MKSPSSFNFSSEIIYSRCSLVSALSQWSAQFLKCSVRERITCLCCEGISRHITDVAKRNCQDPGSQAACTLSLGSQGFDQSELCTTSLLKKPQKLMTATPQPSCQKSNSTAQLKPGGLSNHQSPGHEQNPPPSPRS